MSEGNLQFWKRRERKGDKKIETVFVELENDCWLTTKEVAARADLPINLVLNILHYLVHTQRALYRIGGSGRGRGYQWAVKN